MASKLIERLTGLSKSMKPITEKQKEYFIKSLKHPFLKWKGEAVCWNCGQHFLTELKKGEQCECPTCHSKGIIETGKSHKTDDIYYCTTERMDNYQVIRMYFVNVWYFREPDFEGMYHRFRFRECYRNFISEKGVCYNFARGMRSFCGYCMDPWNWQKELHYYKQSSCGYYYYSDVCDQNPFVCYPYGSVTPFLRKKGFTGNLREATVYSSPKYYLKSLLTNSKTETITKRKEFRWFALGEGAISSYWDEIKICFRHGYYPKDMQMWRDTIHLAEGLKMDIHNPKYVCPEDLQELHDQLSRKMAKLEEKRRKEALKKKMLAEKNREPNYQKFLETYRNVCITGNGFVIKPIPTSDDFFYLGDKMHQCLATCHYYMKFTSLVMSAWVEGEIVENLEVDLKDLHIIQCHGNCNHNTKYHEQIIDLVNSKIRGEFAKNKIRLLTA